LLLAVCGFSLGNLTCRGPARKTAGPRYKVSSRAVSGAIMSSSACNQRARVKSRREFLQRSSFGFGALALEQLLNRNLLASGQTTDLLDPLGPRSSHFVAKAKQVIFIFLQGGPSQVDTFDPKPVLSRLDGQFLPESFLQEETTLAQIKANESKL